MGKKSFQFELQASEERLTREYLQGGIPNLVELQITKPDQWLPCNWIDHLQECKPAQPVSTDRYGNCDQKSIKYYGCDGCIFFGRDSSKARTGSWQRCAKAKIPSRWGNINRCYYGDYRVRW